MINYKEEILKDKSFCFKYCNFLKYNENGFVCEFYEDNLKSQLTLSENSLRPLRCQGCIIDEEQHNNRQRLDRITDYLEKIKNFTYLIEEELVKIGDK